MDVVSVIVSGLEHLGVGFEDGRLLCEFLLEVAQGGVERTVEEPAYQAESEDVAAFEDALVVEAAVGQGCLGHGRDGHFDNLGFDAEFLKRIVGCVLSLLEVAFAEGVDIDDDHSTGLEEAVVLLEGSGVHRNEHVATVAGGVDTFADAYLEARHASKRTLWSAYFGRVVRECRHLVAETGRHVCKDVAGQLHSVAGVAGKADNNLVESFYIGILQHDLRN